MVRYRCYKSFKDDPEEINEDNLYVVFGVSRWP